MSRLPRLALGTIQAEADGAPMAWALLDALDRLGLHVQTFLARSHFVPRDGAMVITGLCPRYLDSWLMSPEMCRQALLRSAAASDMALVEGRFASALQDGDAGGDLETLCRWLDLPRLAVVDVRLLTACHLPPRPDGVDGLLLDGLAEPAQYYKVQTQLESLWGLPVLGGLEHLRAVREAIRRLPAGAKPPRDLCRTLGDSLHALGQIERIARIADGRDFAFRSAAPAHHFDAARPVRVAAAFDEAFHCYFPETLEMLEAGGASISEFSPLRDERLPAETDIVYLGCGHPERFARELLENHCLISALREHLCNGRRIYAEGGGLAYLCQHLELADGQMLPMVGGFPAVARLNPHPEPPRPAEVTLAVDTWLGPAGSRLRGYVNSNWIIEPVGGGVRRYLQDTDHPWDLIGRHQAIGSRLHLNFSAQPQVLDHFFQSHAAFLDVAPRTAAPPAR